MVGVANTKENPLVCLPKPVHLLGPGLMYGEHLGDPTITLYKFSLTYLTRAAHPDTEDT